MRWRFAVSIGLALVPALVVLAAVGLLAFDYTTALRADQSRVTDSYQRLTDMQAVLADVQDAETGQRGYIITGNAQYLAPYQRGSSALPSALTQLQDVLAGNPTQLSRLSLLRSEIDAKLAELQQTIALRQSGQSATATAIVESNSGQQDMERIKSLLQSMTQAETDQLRKSNAAALVTGQRAIAVVLLVCLLALALTGFFGVLLLLAEQRRAKTAASDAERAALVRATFESITDAIVAIDHEGRLIVCNRQFVALIDCPPRIAAPGMPMAELLAKAPPALRARLSGQTEAPEITLDGGTILAVRNSRMPAANDFVGGSIFIVTDITEARQKDLILRKAQKLEAAGQLTGGVAHDFNNLLQIVSGNLELAMRSAAAVDGTRKIRSTLQTAMAALERGARLTSQLLAFARRQPLEPCVINPERLVRAMTELLRRSLGEGIEIEMVTVGGLWNTIADESQLESALLNLAINARDAMSGHGKLTIELTNACLDDDYSLRHEEVKPGQYVLLAVTDTGTGMTPDVIERAFDPFFSTKEEGRGNGLGLSQVFGFAKQSGGHVKIYSELGIGTTVKLYMPRAVGAEAARPPTLSEPQAASGELVLLVEDDAGVRAANAAMLADLGYRVIEAENADIAWPIVQEIPTIDLLFTDIVMPGQMSGRELADRAVELRPEIKVLFTSGYTENSIVHNGRLDQGVNLISKPFKMAQLARKLRSVLCRPAPASAEPAKPSTADSDISPDNIGDEKSPMAILVVEDEALIAMLLETTLEDAGYRAIVVGTARDALDVIDNGTRISALITDIGLPDMNGEDLAQTIRSQLPEVPVIITSGAAAERRDSGFVYVSKPYSYEHVVSLLDRQLLAPYASPVASRSED